jgi:hypothetical protein
MLDSRLFENGSKNQGAEIEEYSRTNRLLSKMLFVLEVTADGPQDKRSRVVCPRAPESLLHE